jgi:hypothetical protein
MAMQKRSQREVVGSRCTTGIIDTVPMRGTRAEQSGDIFTMNRRKTITFIAVWNFLLHLGSLLPRKRPGGGGREGLRPGRLHGRRGAGHDKGLRYHQDRVVDIGETQRPGVAGTKDLPKDRTRSGRIIPSAPPASPRQAPAGRPSTHPSARGSPRGSC